MGDHRLSGSNCRDAPDSRATGGYGWTQASLVGGLMIFTISSAFCGVASSLAMLLLARLFRGVGGALLMAVALAMLTSAFSPAERGRALCLNAITAALGISAGPPLGGLILSVLNWRWI